MTKSFLFCLAALMLGSFAPLFAQRSAPLQLASGLYPLSPGIPADIAPASGEIFDGRCYRVVQFWHTPTLPEQLALREAGLGLEEYLHSHAYLTSAPATFDWSRVANLRAVARLQPQQKLSKRLAEGFRPDWAWQENLLGITVQWLPQASAEAVAAALPPLVAGVTATDPLTRTLTIYTLPENIEAVAAIPAVHSVDLVSPPATPEDNRARGMHRANLVDRDHALGRKYNGEGISVGLYDDGLVGPHLDFTGRTDQTLVGTVDNGTHGDMTGGIIAGAGNLDPRMRGMATHAFLHVFNYASNLPQNQSYHINQGVSVYSVSYSDGCNAGYTSTTQKTDNDLFSYPNMMVVFSAGNAGDQDCGYGAGAGWGNITGGHKMAKNCIATANLNENESLESSSSRGPAHDGRLKPDIAANGQGQYSTDPNNTYAEGGGTSAACPSIAGIVAQLNHAYRSLNGGDPAPGALLKACLLNTAHDMGQPGPDYRYGWGRVNAFRALTILEDGRYQSGSLAQGDTNIHTVVAPAGALAMRVMLYWADPAASTLSSRALINDLNMSMLSPAGDSLYRPFLLDYRPGFQNQPAGNGIDSMNNAEQIQVNLPAGGLYTIHIHGKDIPQGVVSYYLVYEFIGEEVTLTQPVGGEGFEPGAKERIYWDAWGNTGTFTLDYSLNNGQTWIAIASNITATARFYDWQVPASLNSDQVKVRVRRGTAASASPDFFAILPVVNENSIAAIQVCPDSALIAWDAVNGADAYELYMLGAKHMELKATSADNFVFIPITDPNAGRWLAVRPLGPHAVGGLRSKAHFQAGGLIDCVIYTDVAANEVLSPAGSMADCLGQPSAARVVVANTGENPQANFPVFVQIEGNAPDSVVYTGTLQPGAKDTLAIALSGGTWASNTNLSVKVWTGLANDELSNNDTLQATFRLESSSVVSLPYAQTFEAFAKCSGTTKCEQEVCNLSESWRNDLSGSVDDHDWRTFSGATPSPNTGPGVDHTLGNSSGLYLYLEANDCANKVAMLTSPCIDLTGTAAPELSFWYHMTGVDMGSLALDVYDGTSWHSDVMPVISGNKSNTWFNRKVSLGAFAGKQITLRFRGRVGTGYRSDMALDDIAISDLGVGVAPSRSLMCVLAPNPSHSSMMLHWNDLSAGTLHLHLTDLQGKVLLEQQVAAAAGSHLLDISGFASGLYLLRVRTASGTQTVLKAEITE